MTFCTDSEANSGAETPAQSRESDKCLSIRQIQPIQKKDKVSRGRRGEAQGKLGEHCMAS